MLAKTSKRFLIGTLMALGTLQYFAAELAVASAWPTPPGYSYATNYISDLGVTTCYQMGQFELDRTVCSPLATIMNVSFVLQGILVLGTLVALWKFLPRAARRFVAPLVVIHALGIIIVGLFPGSISEALGGNNLRAMLHTIGGGMAIVGGSLMVCAAAILSAKTYPLYALLSGTLGLTGLVATGLFVFEQTFGLGIGTIERLAVNPTVVWIALTGAVLLTRQLRHTRTYLFE